MGGLIVPPSRDERLGKRMVIVNGEVMLEAWPDGAPTHVRRVLASDPADEDGRRAGVEVPVVGGLAQTLAGLAEDVPARYEAAWAVAAEVIAR